MARTFAILALTVFGFAAGPQAALAQEAIIGILEEHPGGDGAKPTAYVRAVFHKEGGAWTAYDPACAKGSCFPRETNWTIGFDGKSVGQVRAATPPTWPMMSDVGRQNLAAGARAPFVGQRADKFAGWAGGPVYRPLVGTSTGHVTDPEAWKAGAIPAAADQALRERMRAKFPTAERCASPEENVPKTWSYGDKDLVVDGGYVSASGWRVARVGLKPEDYRCDGPMETSGESAFSILSVAIAPDGKMIDLGFDMRLLDAGDYDADGKSELVFFYSHYNADGYKLFSNGFAEQAAFGFSFH
ncbi:MAG: hypothetical protein EOP61_01810 [Sphingomonadales bacterium]|nr:MAG: hypothetical protein EOP61_01810 [Sphingomonadales bacterium]